MDHKISPKNLDSDNEEALVKLTITFIFRFFDIFFYRTFLFDYLQSPFLRLLSPPTGLYEN